MAGRKKKTNTSRVHNTLFHGETLLVVSTGDLEDVSSELGTDAVTRNFLTHTLLHENTEKTLIFNLNQLLSALGGVAIVEVSSQSLILRFLCFELPSPSAPSPYPFLSSSPILSQPFILYARGRELRLKKIEVDQGRTYA